MPQIATWGYAPDPLPRRNQALLAYARGKFEDELYPFAPALRPVRDVLAKIDLNPKPELPAAKKPYGLRGQTLYRRFFCISKLGKVGFAAGDYNPSFYDLLAIHCQHDYARLDRDRSAVSDQALAFMGYAIL
jgi:hypothetical protein